MKQEEIYKRITDKIIEELEKGYAPWQRPWASAGGSGLPISWKTKKPYRGINLFLLPMVYGEYATFNQIKAAGGTVNKGARGHFIVYYERKKKRDVETREETDEFYFLMKTYYVFDVLTQVTGLKPHRQVGDAEQRGEKHNPIEAAEQILNGFKNGPKVAYASGSAYYNPATDAMCIPPMEDYKIPEEFYCTAFHEFVHATGHEKRLNRPGIVESRTIDKYSKEELIAEIGAAMLCATAGIEQMTIDNSVAYVGGWLEKLRNDHKLIVIAARQAQSAADLILGSGAKEAEETEEESQAKSA